MSTPMRVFAILGDGVLRQTLQQQWRSNGIALCAMHAEGSVSLAEELGRLRPHVLVADAEVDGVRELVQSAARRYRIPTVCIVRAQQQSLAALRPLEWGAVELVVRRESDVPSLVRDVEDCVHALRDAQVVEQLESVFPLSGAFPDASVFDLRRALRAVRAADKVIVIAAGTGGPMAVRRILTTLRGETCSPIVYAQKLPHALRDVLVQWLEAHTGAVVRPVIEGQPLEVGHVYVTSSTHETVRMTGSDGRAWLQVGPMHGDAKPLNALLHSTAATFGARAVGVVLSGRGDDGCAGLLALRAAGGLTIAQDRASSALYEAPGCAREAGGAIECLPINEIAERIRMLMHADHAARL